MVWAVGYGVYEGGGCNVGARMVCSGDTVCLVCSPPMRARRRSVGANG